MGTTKERPGNEAGIPEVFEPCCGLYPGIISFTDEYDATDYREWVSRSNGEPVPAPLMLVVQDGSQADRVTGREEAIRQIPWYTVIAREIQLQGALFDKDRPLEGVVCAPGIAAGWSNDALYELCSTIQNAFSIAPAAFSRWCACFGRTRPSAARLQLLRVLGFSRIRLRIDLSSSCQGGSEPSAEFERAERLLAEARNLGYRSLAIDLVLPAVLTDALSDRIELFLVQTRTECFRLIAASGEESVQSDGILQTLRSEVLPGLGYRHLGLDWYVTEAEPSLGKASSLYWSPLGYTDIDGLDIIGVGPAAVTVLEDASSQNAVQRENYQRLVKGGEIPTERGIELESDDTLRRAVLCGLLVDERFDIGVLEGRWGIVFSRYFETEMAVLRELEQQGKLVLGEHEIRTLARDRESLRALCRIFDNQERIARVRPLQEMR